MRKKTGMKLILAAAALSISAASLAYAGEWRQDETGFWYVNDSGSYARDQMMNIDGATYGFDTSAYMVTGWKQFDSKWYYFEPENGHLATGWKQIGDKWYYLDEAAGGAMKTSWLRQGTKIYYLKEDGSMQEPNTRFYVNSFAYETDGTGAIKRNTSEELGDGRIFIYEDDGKMKYKNGTLATANKAAGTDLYIYLLEGDLNEQAKVTANEAIQDGIIERKDELYERYRSKVRTATGSVSRATRRERWEADVREQLGELGETEENISAYIRLVESGRYEAGDDDYDDYYDYDDYDD